MELSGEVMWVSIASNGRIQLLDWGLLKLRTFLNDERYEWEIQNARWLAPEVISWKGNRKKRADFPDTKAVGAMGAASNTGVSPKEAGGLPSLDTKSSAQTAGDNRNGQRRGSTAIVTDAATHGKWINDGAKDDAIKKVMEK